MKKSNKTQMRVAILSVLTVFTLSSFAQEAPKTKSYQGIIELDVATLFQKDMPIFSRVDFINGYKFNPNVSMGLGIGIRFVPKEIGGSQMIPVYGNLRANLFYEECNNVYPYIQTSLGVMFVTKGSERGTFVRQSFGVGFKNSPVSIGISGEIFSTYFSSPIIIGLNFGFSF